MTELLGLLVSSSSYGALAFVLIIGWLITAAAYSIYYGRSWFAPCTRAIARMTGAAVSKRTRATRTPPGFGKRAVCGDCQSIFPSALGACDTCRAPIANASPFPETLA